MVEDQITPKQKSFFFGAIITMILIGTLIVQGNKWNNRRGFKKSQMAKKEYLDSLRQVPRLEFYCQDSVHLINLDSLIDKGFHITAFINTKEGETYLSKQFRHGGTSNSSYAYLNQDQEITLHGLSDVWPGQGKYTFFLNTDQEGKEAFREGNMYADRFVLAREDFRLTESKCD